eukprot:gene14026-biopygen8065
MRAAQLRLLGQPFQREPPPPPDGQLRSARAVQTQGAQASRAARAASPQGLQGLQGSQGLRLQTLGNPPSLWTLGNLPFGHRGPSGHWGIRPSTQGNPPWALGNPPLGTGESAAGRTGFCLWKLGNPQVGNGNLHSGNGETAYGHCGTRLRTQGTGISITPRVLPYFVCFGRLRSIRCRKSRRATVSGAQRDYTVDG